jgi:hypothetical protein
MFPVQAAMPIIPSIARVLAPSLVFMPPPFSIDPTRQLTSAIGSSILAALCSLGEKTQPRMAFEPAILMDWKFHHAPNGRHHLALIMVRIEEVVVPRAAPVRKTRRSPRMVMDQTARSTAPAQ